MANEIAKGVQALNKGMAMFAWMEPVRDALLEVGDLEKELGALDVRIARAEDAAELVEADLAKLRDAKTGVDAEAVKLIEAAKEEAADLIGRATAAAEKTVADAEKVLEGLRADAETQAALHEAFMAGVDRDEKEATEKLYTVETALAEIQAKFG